MKVEERENNAHLFLRTKKEIASFFSFSSSTAPVGQGKYLTVSCPLY